MIRVNEHQIKLQTLSAADQATLINAILAVAHMRLKEAAGAIRARLEPLGWYVYEAGHHIAVGKTGSESSAPLKLFDIEDPYLSIQGFPNYLCEERRFIGLSINGHQGVKEK